MKLGRFQMFSGSLIDDLIATVERVEQHSNLVPMRLSEGRWNIPASELAANQNTENWVGVA